MGRCHERGDVLPPGGGLGAVDLHALRCDPLGCDSSGRWGMVHACDMQLIIRNFVQY